MRRRGLVIGAVAAGVLVVGAGIAAWVLTRPPSVEDAAMRYLGALAGGEIAAVEATGAELSTPDADLAAQAFAGAAAYIADPRIDRTSPVDADGTALIDVSFDLGEARRTSTLLMRLSDGSWVPGGELLGALTATTSLGDSIDVGGVAVPAGEPVALLPAVYAVTALPADVLDGAADAAVLPGTPVDVALEATLSPDAAALAQGRLDAYADECTAPSATVPAACGIRIPWAADLVELERVSFRIEQRPAIALSPDDGTFAATGGILVATARGSTRAGEAGVFTYRADDWSLYGSLGFTGDQMRLAVR